MSQTRRIRALAVLILSIPLIALAIAPAHAHRGSSRSLSAQLSDVLGFEDRAVGAPLLRVGPTMGVQPGAAVESTTGQCSLGFLFAGGDGSRYMGTAGHCILTDPGERAWTRGSGPVARDGLGRRVGEFAYAVFRPDRELDFALVRPDPAVDVSPQMPTFGGPTRINDERSSEPSVLHYCGSGVAVGVAVSCRSGVALGMPDPRHVYIQAVATPGDSGGPVTSSDGRAVGLLVTTGLHLESVGTEGVDAGLAGVARLTPQLESAEQGLGTNLELITSPA